jgi:cytochrome c biogenesis protein CcmG/thiol:disulfide interchange protein DsbE
MRTWARMRRLTPILVCAALLGGCGDDPESAAPPAEEARGKLAGAPAPLAGLHRQANQLLGGGAQAFEDRLRALRGHPVVVNKWASWCPPCRDEFPYFQRLSVELGRKVAFIGVDSRDDTGPARAFLEDYPLSYPSYEDPDEAVAKVFGGHLAFPATAFYDRSGRRVFVKQGGYESEARLREDIERYAR